LIGLLLGSLVVDEIWTIGLVFHLDGTSAPEV
jgi:hypothetical protein